MAGTWFDGRLQQILPHADGGVSALNLAIVPEPEVFANFAFEGHWQKRNAGVALIQKSA
jgi:hypothetical protein